MTRRVLAITGSDRISFLQGLITNDITKAEGGLVYAALLTPQGKFIADFFATAEDERILIDVAESHAAALAQRLAMYRLRADVQIEETDLIVSTGLAGTHGFADPRHPALGWRAYGDTDISEVVDWDALYVAHVIPQTGIELTPESYILEAGFERLNGIDFRKGCYVGQEIAARMKHKTELRKGLAKVHVEGDADPGDEITANGKSVGVLHTRSGDTAIAYLRFDRAGAEMQAGAAKVTRAPKA